MIYNTVKKIFVAIMPPTTNMCTQRKDEKNEKQIYAPDIHSGSFFNRYGLCDVSTNNKRG